MIDLKAFNKSIAEFDKREHETNFFGLARNLIKNGFETEGFLLILGTWNFASFRYAVKTFDVDDFSTTMFNLNPHFERLNGENFKTINFDNYKVDISAIYHALSQIQGIQHTGAPKLMHLKTPDVFVMWDSYIRGDKSKRRYQDLDIFASGRLEIKKYSKDGDGYIEFLKEMQRTFKHITPHGDKTLAKVVDEFNFINITLPMQEMEREERKNKKEKKQSLPK